MEAEEEQSRRVRVSPNDILRPAAVMYVKVNDSHSLNSVPFLIQGVESTSSDAIEYTEPRRLILGETIITFRESVSDLQVLRIEKKRE